MAAGIEEYRKKPWFSTWDHSPLMTCSLTFQKYRSILAFTLWNAVEMDFEMERSLILWRQLQPPPILCYERYSRIIGIIAQPHCKQAIQSHCGPVFLASCAVSGTWWKIPGSPCTVPQQRQWGILYIESKLPAFFNVAKFSKSPWDKYENEGFS